MSLFHALRARTAAAAAAVIAVSLVTTGVTAADAADETDDLFNAAQAPSDVTITRASTEHVDISWTPPRNTTGVKGYFIFLEAFPNGYTSSVRHGNTSSSQEFYEGATTSSTRGDSLEMKFEVDPTITYRAQVFSATRVYDTVTTLYAIDSPENVGWNYSALYTAPEGTSDGIAPHPILVGATTYRTKSCLNRLTVDSRGIDLQKDWDDYLALYQTDQEDQAQGSPPLPTATPYPAITALNLYVYRNGQRWKTWHYDNADHSTPTLKLPAGTYTTSSSYSSSYGEGAEVFYSTSYTVLDCTVDAVKPAVRTYAHGGVKIGWKKPNTHANTARIIYFPQIFEKKASGWKSVYRTATFSKSLRIVLKPGKAYRLAVRAEDSADSSWRSLSKTTTFRTRKR